MNDPRCGCDDGWLTAETTPLTVRPCPACKSDQHRTWAEGGWRLQAHIGPSMGAMTEERKQRNVAHVRELMTSLRGERTEVPA